MADTTDAEAGTSSAKPDASGAASDDSSPGGANKVCSLICSYLLPPLGVYWRKGISNEFWICLLLTLLFWFPGLVYACCVVGLD